MSSVKRFLVVAAITAAVGGSGYAQTSPRPLIEGMLARKSQLVVRESIPVGSVKFGDPLQVLGLDALRVTADLHGGESPMFGFAFGFLLNVPEGAEVRQIRAFGHYLDFDEAVSLSAALSALRAMAEQQVDRAEKGDREAHYDTRSGMRFAFVDNYRGKKLYMAPRPFDQLHEVELTPAQAGEFKALLDKGIERLRGMGAK